jgi:hypothetical protein
VSDELDEGRVSDNGVELTCEGLNDGTAGSVDARKDVQPVLRKCLREP